MSASAHEAAGARPDLGCGFGGPRKHYKEARCHEKSRIGEPRVSWGS